MGTNDCLAVGDRIGDYVIDFVWDSDVGDATYDATHVLLPRRARLSVASRPAGAVRLMREACILEALHHPGVPRVFEVGVLAAPSEAPRPWVATEILYGQSLLEIALLVGKLPVRDVLGVMRDIGDTLAYAHKRGVAHGNVRPDEIVRVDGSRERELCLVNWHAARVLDTEDDQQRAFADDVFALGLVADLALVSRASVPADVAALIDDMLAPDPTSRPRAHEVAARAKQLLEAIDASDDDVVLEEDVVLDELSDDDILDDVTEGLARGTRPQKIVNADTTPDAAIPMQRTRGNWTPAIRMDPTPARGIPVAAVSKPQS